jgi:SCL-interrupting locus protein N-terminus
MEDKKRSRSEFLPSIAALRSISLYASKGNLWPRVHTGVLLQTDLSQILPVLKITKNFKRSLECLIKDSSFGHDVEVYVKGVENPCNSIELTLHEIQIFSKVHKGEELIKLVPSQDIERVEYELMLESILFTVDSFDEFRYLEIYDICVPIVQYYPSLQSFSLKFNLLFPSVCLRFQPINPLKLVSTALCINLTKKENFSHKFQTGFLTLDQKRRVLPLKITDTHLFKYPLIGVWVTGIKEDLNLNCLAWAACIRFLESRAIHERISPCPDTNTFLFINFSPKPLFYEISTGSKSCWKIISKSLGPGNDEIKFFEDNALFSSRTREKKSFTASTSSSDGRYSRFRASFESDSTEKMIIKQNLMLRSLEKQINELQHALSEPKLVNAETNTTSYFNDSQPIAPTKILRRQSTVVRDNIEVKSKFNPIRSSCNIEPTKNLSDTTITVPKIIYKYDSESCDEEVQFELKYFG